MQSKDSYYTCSACGEQTRNALLSNTTRKLYCTKCFCENTVLERLNYDNCKNARDQLAESIVKD